MSAIVSVILELGMLLVFGSLVGFLLTVFFMRGPVQLMVRMAVRDGRREGRRQGRVLERAARVREMEGMAVVPDRFVVPGEFYGGPFDGVTGRVRLGDDVALLWDDEGVVSEDRPARYVWRGKWGVKGVKVFEFDGQPAVVAGEGRGRVPGDD